MASLITKQLVLGASLALARPLPLTQLGRLRCGAATRALAVDGTASGRLATSVATATRLRGGSSMLTGAAISFGVIGSFNALGAAITLASPETGEKVTDLFGCGAIATSAAVTFFASPAPRPLRAVLLTACVSVWGVRLAGYLFHRVLTRGNDARLSEFYKEKKMILTFWAVSAAWGFATALPQTLVCFSPAAARPLGPLGVAAALAFAAACSTEALADWQKFQFKQDPQRAKRWTDVGLWSLCRHPNYAAEIACWTSAFLLAAPGLVLSHGSLLARVGGVGAAALSPIFIAVLLTRFSGIPLAEARYDKLYGHMPEYQAYKRDTPLLMPRFWPANSLARTED
jgi:steroid 5-alpha reductase family enzyme